MEKYYSTNDLMAELHIGRNTALEIMKLSGAGKLTHKKTSRYIISESKLKEYLESKETIENE